MIRNEVYKAISSERDYQDEMSKKPYRPDMIEDMHIGDILSAITYNLNQANAAWYKGSVPHTESVMFLRKIAALCVKAGEIYGMPFREGYSLTSWEQASKVDIPALRFELGSAGFSEERIDQIIKSINPGMIYATDNS